MFDTFTTFLITCPCGFKCELHQDRVKENRPMTCDRAAVCQAKPDMAQAFTHKAHYFINTKGNQVFTHIT